MFDLHSGGWMHEVPAYAHSYDMVLQVQQADNAVVSNDVTIVSSDGKRLVFPSYVTAISPVIADFMKRKADGIEKGDLNVPFDHQTLTRLLECVNQLPEAAYADGKRVEARNIQDKTVIVHRELQPKISPLINNVSDTELANLFKAADFLVAKPFIRAYLDNVAKRIIPTILDVVNRYSSDPITAPLSRDELGQVVRPIFLDKIWGSSQGQFKLCPELKKRLGVFQIPSHHLSHLRMYVYLQFTETPPFTFEEYIARYGQPEFYEQSKSLYLSDQGITSLYGIHLIEATRVQNIDLDGNWILGSDLDPDFPSRPFASFPGLIELYIRDNQIGELPGDTFDGLSNLQRLNMAINQLDSLPVQMFRGNMSLDDLSLSYNQFSELSTQTFQGLGNLKSLSLMGNKLSSIPANVFSGLGNLETLMLRENQIRSLSAEAFQGLQHLQTLMLEYNWLSSVPAGVFQPLRNVESIILEHNRLTSLPARSFQGLDKLMILSLNHNQLSSLSPSVFWGMPKDKFLLNISYNGISGTQEEFLQKNPDLRNGAVVFDPQFEEKRDTSRKED